MPAVILTDTCCWSQLQDVGNVPVHHPYKHQYWRRVLQEFRVHWRREVHEKKRKEWKFKDGYGKIEHWDIFEMFKNGKNRQIRIMLPNSGEHPVSLCAKKERMRPVRGI
jgi:hypothetical protein